MIFIYRKGKIEAVLLGNSDRNFYYSHQGLTDGGLIMSSKLKAVEVVEIFELLNIEFGKIGITEVIYKPIPHIYHRLPVHI